MKKIYEEKDIEYNGKFKNFSIAKNLNKYIEKIRREFKINSGNFKLYAKVKNNLNSIEIETENDYKNILNNPDFITFIVIDSNNQNKTEKIE